jgi:hypothetical protein
VQALNDFTLKAKEFELRVLDVGSSKREREKWDEYGVYAPDVSASMRHALGCVS